MRRLTQAPNTALASLWADMLRQGGIDASVQRYYASGIAGEIPVDQALPEIWVQDDQLDSARALLADLQRPGVAPLGVPDVPRSHRWPVRAVLAVRHGDAASVSVV